MTAKKNRAKGKRNEKALAKILGGKRVGILSGEDISHPIFSIEAKSRKSVVIEKWMKQAEVNAPIDKIPLLIIHTHNSRRGNDIVCMRMKDWINFYGEVQT